MTKRVNLEQALRNIAKEKISPAGVKYLSLGLTDSGQLARRYKKNLRSVEIIALKNKIIPERYQRNMGTVGLEGQEKLLSSSVAVIGLGGLGGLVTQLFARMGIGTLVIIDGDNFSESNLNRQALSTVLNLGKSKADEATRNIKEINGAIEVSSYSCFADKNKLLEIMENVHVAVDCLDNLKTRFELESACQELGIPLVHAAIAGNIGQLAVIWPGEPLLSSVYGAFRGGDLRSSGNPDTGGHGIEIILGNPATTPALIGSWQVSETIKVLLNQENVLRNELLYIDMANNETTRIPIKT